MNEINSFWNYLDEFFITLQNITQLTIKKFLIGDVYFYRYG